MRGDKAFRNKKGRWDGLRNDGDEELVSRVKIGEVEIKKDINEGR